MVIAVGEFISGIEEQTIVEERRIRINPTFQDIVRSELKRERLRSMTKQND